MPNFSPAVTTEYLNEIIKPDSNYFKVSRKETHTIPKGTKRNFSALETFELLENLLIEKR